MPQKNKFVRNNSRGFTLIELLMVIAIIGILAAIIMVNMSGMRAKANKINAFSALKSAAEAATMCLTNGGALLNAPGKTGGGDFYSGGNAGILAAAGGNGFICKDGSPEKYSDISDTGFYYGTGEYIDGANFCSAGANGSNFDGIPACKNHPNSYLMTLYDPATGGTLLAACAFNLKWIGVGGTVDATGSAACKAFF